MASDTLSVLAEDRPDAAAAQVALQAEANADFEQAVLDGLSRSSRSLPSRFLYDERGSELFEDITRLKEYYPTRAETEILETRGGEFAKAIGPGRAVVEFGSGSRWPHLNRADEADGREAIGKRDPAPPR